MERREIIGNVVSTELNASLNDTDTSFTTVDDSATATFPTGSTNPFVVVINRGKANEEKMLISARSSNTFTVLERGYDNITASSHNSGSTVDHVLDATAMQDMNKTTYDNEILHWMGA